MGKNETKTINIKVEPEFFDYINKYCEEVGQNKRVALTRIIKNYLDNYYEQDEDKRRPL